MKYQLQNNKPMKNKTGVILFVVLGGIFVLTILILSYNFLVQGKFHEQKELLKHNLAMKSAQSITRFIIDQLKYDLAQSVTNSDRAKLLKEEILPENDSAKLAEKLNSEWLSKIDYLELLKKLLPSQLSKDSSTEVTIGFEDVKPLKSYAKGNEVFFNFEKIGKISIETKVQIGRLKEEWKSVYPFRIIVPYPTPLTKFTLYVPQATTVHDPTKLNTVSIGSPASGNIAPQSPRPVYFYNSMFGNDENKDEDVWKRRGWIYLGGGNLYLNRAASHLRHGQRYFSYFPTANLPIALSLKFSNFTSIQAAGKTFSFKMARWGFSEALTHGPYSAMWKTILKNYMTAHSISTDKSWWRSSCLHLFGDVKNNRSITRVCGNVYDRFLEIGYIIPGAGEAPIGAVTGLSKNSFEKYSGKKRNWLPGQGKDITKTFRKNVFIEKDLLTLAAPLKRLIGVNNLDDLKDFFKDMPYKAPGNALCFYRIMSKPSYCMYDETYKMISQYEQNSNNLGIPPKGDIPASDNLKFLLDIPGIDSKNLQIDKIAINQNSAMEKRVCYEIKKAKGDRQSLFQILKKDFCMEQNNDFDLHNSVLKVVSGANGLKLENNLGTHSGGTIISEGPLLVGTFKKVSEDFKSPLVFMSEKGSITVNNGSRNATLAYLVALDKTNGELKLSYTNRPLKLIGGIATTKLSTNQIVGGGSIIFNHNLDPTGKSFASCIGMVIGPEGGLNAK